MLTPFILTVTAALAALPLAATRSAGAAGLAGQLAAPARAVPRAAFALSAAAVLLLALVQAFVVVAVSVFSVSVVWLQDLTQYLFGAAFLLAAGAVLLTDGHVRVDLFYSRWSPRRRALVDLLGLTLFVLPVCALILIASAPYVAASWAELERSPEPSGVHAVYLLKSMIPGFAVLLGLAAFARAADAAQALRGAADAAQTLRGAADDAKALTGADAPRQAP